MSQTTENVTLLSKKTCIKINTKRNPGQLPRYLHKRKLEILKQKILLRKYGYIFYRKTISNILLSTAEKYYKHRVLRKAFLKLKANWFEQKAQWRLVLRANLHYKFALKRKMFCKWQYAVVKRKEKALKLSIVTLHYQNKVKYKCLISLTYIGKFNMWHQLLTSASHLYAVYLFLHGNLLTMTCIYHNLQMEYFIIMMYCKAFKNRMLKICFKNLQFYKQAQIVQRNNEQIIKLFRKLKYNSEVLRIYFENWQNFTQLSVIKRLKLEIAKKQWENKLKQLCLLRFKIYKDHQQTKTKNKEIAEQFYNRKLVFQSLRNWISYTSCNIEKAAKIRAGNQFYQQKLKDSCFKKLKAYKTARKKKKEIIVMVENIANIKLKNRYYLGIKNYFMKCRIKRQKYDSANKLHNNRLMRKCLTAWLNYAKIRRCKKLKQEQLITNFIKTKELKTIRMCFQKWKIYETYILQKQLKLMIANKHHKSVLLKKSVLAWITFLNQKKTNQNKYKMCEAHYTSILIRNAFNKWKYYTKQEKTCKTLISKAKELHHKSLLRDGIKIIISAGSERQKFNQNAALKRVEKHFSITLKYFKIWKYKTLFQSESDQEFGATKATNWIFPVQFNTSQSDYDTLANFKWNPLCFEQPRISEYFKNN